MNKAALLFITILPLVYSIGEAEILPPELPDPTKGMVEVHVMTINNQPLSRMAITSYIEGKPLFRNTDMNGVLRFQIDNGYHTAVFVADEFTTPVEDYVSDNISFFVNKSTSFKVVMFPVGRIKGGCIPNTSIEIKCYSSHPLKEQMITCDEYGQFSVLAPVGTCNVKTVNGSYEVNVERGKFTDINGSQYPSFSIEFGLIVFVLLFVIILIIFGYLKKSNYLKKSKDKGDKAQSHLIGRGNLYAHEIKEMTQRLDDSIFKTLSRNEEKIVKYLISRGGWARQSDMIKELGMSRATFFRSVSSLESRRIVRKIKKGINVTVELTPIFLQSVEKTNYEQV